MAIETFTWVPDAGGAAEPAFSVRTAQFGDGYQQRVGDGINPIRWSVPVTFKDVEADVGDAIEAFILRHQGAKAFLFQRPFGELGIYTCTRYQRTPTGHSGLSTITATFEQVFHS